MDVLITASAGLIGVFAGVWLNSQADHRRWLRQERRSACVELVQACESATSEGALISWINAELSPQPKAMADKYRDRYIDHGIAADHAYASLRLLMPKSITEKAEAISEFVRPAKALAEGVERDPAGYNRPFMTLSMLFDHFLSSHQSGEHATGDGLPLRDSLFVRPL